METQKLKVDELKLSDIVNEFSKGKIRIPRFQRNYVWDKPRVIKLLNSIYNEYPIGTFFFWEASAEYKSLFRNITDLNIPEPDGSQPFQFILDGQQRITSLYVVIKGLKLTINDRKQRTKTIDYAMISFDLDKEVFVVKKPDSKRYVSLSSILDQDHLELFRSLSDTRAHSFQRCYNTFSTYPLSVVYVKDQDLVRACEIFERINQGGVKLNLFDLVVTSTWDNDFDLKEEVAKINEGYEKTFGSLDPEVYLQTLSLLAKGQATRVAQLQLTNEEVKQFWSQTVDAIGATIDYLVSNLGVKIYSFIPYRSMIPMIAYLYANSPHRSLNSDVSKFLDEWFWKCTFSGRYNVSTASFMGEDRRDLFDPILKGQAVTIDYPINLSEKDIIDAKIARYSGLRNGIICLLASLKPKHLKNGKDVTLDRSEVSDYNSPEKHHIFPKAFLKKNPNASENSISNFIFIPAELNNEISDKPPSEYFTNFKNVNVNFEQSLKSHILPSDRGSGIWNDDYNTFLKQRSSLIFREIEKRVGNITSIQQQLIDNGEKVITYLEEKLRALIDKDLMERYGENYWKTAIPGDIQEQCNKKLTANIKRYPDQMITSGFDLLSFCEFSHYGTIISKNWVLFEDNFISLADFERNFMFLNDFRNGLKHVRKITSIERKQGEAAAEWFITLIGKIEDIEDNEE